MVQAKARVIYNKNVKRNYFEIALDAAAIARSALPGQFVNIKVSDGWDPFLRRPLSIHRAGRALRAMRPGSENYSAVVLLYEIVGKGTEVLSERKSGEYLDIIGPLGNGFRIPYPVTRNPILVAGGMGTAPLVFLAEKLREVKSQKSPPQRLAGPPTAEKVKTLVLIGAKTKDSILCEKEFKELGCEVKIATDDGSRGFKGYISELLKDILRPSSGILHPSLYACGPSLLLKEISRISLEHNISAQLSLESHMACGIGACMGCVIKVTKSQGSRVAGDFEYKRVCKEGPVFAAQEIIWQE